MQIDIPPELAQQLVEAILQERLPLKSKREFQERPFEVLIFNLYTQLLRDALSNNAARGEVKARLVKEVERNDLLMAMVAMIMHQLGRTEIKLAHDADGEWFEKSGFRLQIDRDKKNLHLKLIEEDGKDTKHVDE